MDYELWKECPLCGDETGEEVELHFYIDGDGHDLTADLAECSHKCSKCGWGTATDLLVLPADKREGYEADAIEARTEDYGDDGDRALDWARDEAMLASA